MAQRPSRKAPQGETSSSGSASTGATGGETVSPAAQTRDLARRYLDLWERQVAALAAGSAMPPAMSGSEPEALAGRAAELINIGAVAMADIMAVSARAFAAAASKGRIYDGAEGEQRSEPAGTPAARPAPGAAKPDPVSYTHLTLPTNREV